jgi:hypothetical protein
VSRLARFSHRTCVLALDSAASDRLTEALLLPSPPFFCFVLSSFTSQQHFLAIRTTATASFNIKALATASHCLYRCYKALSQSQLQYPIPKLKLRLLLLALASATAQQQQQPLSGFGITLCCFLNIIFHEMDDVSMMDWQATPPAASVNAVYNPGKSYHAPRV